MSKKRGLSFEEKRVKLLELFHEKQDAFLLKDLEKIAPKEKSIPMQTVKEVLMALVADDLVDTDKIGTSVYFWAFPSKAFASKVKKLDETERSVKELEADNAKMESQIEDLMKNSTEDPTVSKRRIEIQEELSKFEAEKVELLAQINRYKDCDPDQVGKIEEDIQNAEAAVERWTDNVFTIQSYLKNKFHMEDSQIRKAFNIPEDFDYFEEK